MVCVVSTASCKTIDERMVTKLYSLLGMFLCLWLNIVVNGNKSVSFGRIKYNALLENCKK